MAGLGLVEGRSRPLPELCGNLPAHFWRQKRSAPPEIGLDKRQQANLRARERAANAFPSAGESSFVMTHVDGRATSRPMLEPATRPKASLPRTVGWLSRLGGHDAAKSPLTRVSFGDRLKLRESAPMDGAQQRWLQRLHIGDL
ncbi:hypothetical protein GQ600_18842 [Phytophthora cactorum]|nr:hypothetical protein GQ600_18842 [Phytophthora cactorum]